MEIAFRSIDDPSVIASVAEVGASEFPFLRNSPIMDPGTRGKFRSVEVDLLADQIQCGANARPGDAPTDWVERFDELSHDCSLTFRLPVDRV